MPQRFSFPPNAELAIRPGPPILMRWPCTEGAAGITAAGIAAGIAAAGLIMEVVVVVDTLV